jgi:hypothetical protein
MVNGYTEQFLDIHPVVVFMVVFSTMLILPVPYTKLLGSHICVIFRRERTVTVTPYVQGF